MSAVRIRPVEAVDWETVRDISRRMLIDSPEAFGETLDAVQSRTASEWKAFAEACESGREMAAFLSKDETGAFGFVRADTKFPGLPPSTVLVRLLWVAPHQRQNGSGRELMDAVENWAENRGASQIVLGVMESNLHVQKFYEHLGYVDTGMRVNVPATPAAQVVIMSRRLDKDILGGNG